MRNRQKTIIASGGIAGLALGCGVAWILAIVQIALGPFAVGPETASGNMTFYPPAALTVIVVIALGVGFGLAIGTMVATAIRNEPASAPEQASAEAG
jgi:hypothetical protein